MISTAHPKKTLRIARGFRCSGRMGNETRSVQRSHAPAAPMRREGGRYAASHVARNCSIYDGWCAMSEASLLRTVADPREIEAGAKQVGWQHPVVAQARLCASERNRQCHQQAGGDGDGANDAPGGFFVT